MMMAPRRFAPLALIALSLGGVAAAEEEPTLEDTMDFIVRRTKGGRMDSLCRGGLAEVINDEKYQLEAGGCRLRIKVVQEYYQKAHLRPTFDVRGTCTVEVNLADVNELVVKEESPEWPPSHSALCGPDKVSRRSTTWSVTLDLKSPYEGPCEVGLYDSGELTKLVNDTTRQGSSFTFFTGPDGSIADRLRNAFAHAAKLCGAVEEPF